MPSNSAREVVDRAQQLANRVDPGWRDRTRAAVSRAVKKWAMRLPWPALKTTEDFTLLGKRLFVFPERVGVVSNIVDKTNHRRLETHGMWDKRVTSNYTQDLVDTPCEWEDRGWTPFIDQPGTDTTLQLAAGASEAFEVRVTGFIRDAAASGTALELQRRVEIMTMGGTEYTATDTTWASLEAIEKEFETGTWLKARNPLNSQVITFIPEGEATVQHRTIAIMPIAPVNTVIRVEYFRRPEEIHTEDTPIDNSIDLEYLAWEAAGDLHWMLKERAAAQNAWQKAEQKIIERVRQQKNSPAHKTTRPAFTYYGLEVPFQRGIDF